MRLAVFLLFSVPAISQTASPAGVWEGALSAGTMKLRVAVHIAAEAGGKFSAKMDSLDQNVRGIPITEVFWEPPSLRLALPPLQANYLGEMGAAGDTITGTWSQGGQQLPLVLKRVEKVTELVRPQTPRPPFPYREQSVTVRNPADNVALEGTLTLPPPGAGLKFPALLLISGSGPQDRDETIFAHKPFAVIADTLTRQGFAVLRLDDRGTGKSKGDFRSATTADFRADASAALDFLRARDGIDPKRVGILGHSEGAIAGAMIAAERPDDVAFLITIGGPGIPMAKLLIEQGDAVLKAQGAPDDVLRKQRATQEAMFPLLLSSKGSIEIKSELDAILKTDELPAAEKSVADAQLSQALSPWFRALLAIDPAKYFEKVRCPVLAINGEKDTQVVASSNLAGIAAALKRGGNANVQTATLPKLNHLLQTATTGSPSEYSNIDETIAPEALRHIGEWLSQFASR